MRQIVGVCGCFRLSPVQITVIRIRNPCSLMAASRARIYMAIRSSVEPRQWHGYMPNDEHGFEIAMRTVFPQQSSYGCPLRERHGPRHEKALSSHLLQDRST